jgi:hypothetical protein
MKLYKYRDLSAPDDETLPAACRHSLNDPTEFVWECDYEPTVATIPLLAEALVRFRQRPPAEARAMAEFAVQSGRIESHARPAFQRMIEQCRAEMGLACFGTSSSNEVMWKRYGGGGVGMCIEVDVPASSMNSHLFAVEYPPTKVLHIDELLRACTEAAHARTVYSVALLSKAPYWSPEAEVRFVSKRQDVSVQISGSFLSGVILGPNLDDHSKQRIEDLVQALPLSLPVSLHLAK